jgi:hypothetical protein
LKQPAKKEEPRENRAWAFWQDAQRALETVTDLMQKWAAYSAL